MKKYSKRIISFLLVILTVFSLMSVTASAAPKSDIPEEMLDNSILRALEYTGYNLNSQKNKGTLYQDGHYGAELLYNDPNILTDIDYGIYLSGKETISDSSTETGKAPDVDSFEYYGLCCASFVTYFISNYLPNIEGKDTAFITNAVSDTGMNPQAVVTWEVALDNLVEDGKIEKVGTSSSNVKLIKLVPGDLITFGDSSNSHIHIAVYAGYYNGEQYIIHVCNDRGPEISTVSNMSYAGDKSCYPNGYFHLGDELFADDGSIEIYKKDDRGNALAGAVFIAKNKDTGTMFKIGPTNNNGYAISEMPVPFGDYEIYESIFPTNYESFGTSKWNKTLDKNTPNATITINAVNAPIPGICKIVKTSEDGAVKGIEFRIVGEGIDKTVTTLADGTISIDKLRPGKYTVTEKEYDRYIPQNAKTVTVLSGKTTTIEFDNKLKTGTLKVTKTSEDGFIAGHKFRLYGSSLAGTKIEEYAETDANGIATFNNIPISGNTPYSIEEINTKARYVIPTPQTATIEWNKITNVNFHNALKKWRVIVTKSDAEKGNPQGDASLSGAVYGIYKGSQLVDTYTTDTNGQFITKYYICADDWSIREISPSEGYLLDTEIHNIDVSADNYTIEYNTEAEDLTEQVIKGELSIIKHSDDGNTQLETPEEGAEFEIFLKNAGSYANAAKTERDYLITDENGYEKTKELPYGTYTVHQTKGKEGLELLEDFDVFISKEGHIYGYLANNAIFESRIKIIKIDAESGNTIPCSDIGFKIYRPDGTLVTQKITYPQITELDTFYTNAEGFLITPEPLEYGKNYSLIETAAPYGYVLNSEPLYFDITPDHSTEKDGINIIEVNFPDMPQKGIIKLSKSGEVFSSITENNGIYQPIYEVQNLSGAEFDIIAEEDIYSGGVLRYKKGSIVDSITTNKDTAVDSIPLYLGKYLVIETKASYGTVLNTEPYHVELTYAGQEIEVTQISVSAVNERQKAIIKLKKDMEVNVPFGIGKNNEVLSVSFGLLAKEELIASDGLIIPKDGLLEIAHCDSNGNIDFVTDIPVGAVLYVKELSTDNKYKLSGTKYPCVFNDNQTNPYVEILINDGNPINNELKYGRIIGKKIDECSNILSGAVFGLFSKHSEDYTESNAIMIATSDNEGVFEFTDVPIGDYVLKELSTGNPAYVLNSTDYQISIINDMQVVELDVVNSFVRGNVQVVKVDSEYSEYRLSGAGFKIYADTNNNKEYDKDVDTFIGIMEETETGIYQLNDLKYGGYFLYEYEAPQNYIGDSNYYYFSIEDNGETVTVENTKGIGFVNKIKVGQLKIVKTSDDKKVEGISFRITGTKGYDKVFTTDKNGKILIDNLRVDEIYTITEIYNDKSKGYILPMDATVSIEANKTTTVKMHNTLQPITPSTGDSVNLALWCIITVISLTIPIGIIIYKKRNRADS